MITLAVVTYNRPEDMERLLNNLAEIDSAPGEMVIVDDSEEDATEKVVEDIRQELSFPVEYFRSGEKRTFGESRNDAIKMADEEIICFVDDDTFLVEDYFDILREAYSEFPEVAGIGGPAITTDENLEKLVEIDKSEKNQNWFNEYGEVHDISDRWIPSRPVETDTFRGANMSFKMEKLEEIEGFDPGYEGTGFREEQDVMVRLRKKGEKLLYHPDLKLYHFQADTGGTRDINVETEYWKGRNMIRFVKKNFPGTYRKYLIRMMISNEGDIPPIWKDIAGSIVYKRPERVHKWRGYLDEFT